MEFFRLIRLVAWEEPEKRRSHGRIVPNHSHFGSEIRSSGQPLSDLDMKAVPVWPFSPQNLRAIGGLNHIEFRTGSGDSG
jgi:hypothetical protein